MRFFKQALIVGSATAVLLFLMPVVAPAATLSFRNSLGTRAWQATWSEFGFGERNTRCLLTLGGSFHSNSIAKIRSTLVGYVTSAAVSSCGPFFTPTMLTANRPWHLRYESFSGALPSITAVRFQIIGFEYQIRESLFGVQCLFRSTEAQPLNMEWSLSSGSVTSARLSGFISANCGLETTLSGTPTSFTPAATITLI